MSFKILSLFYSEFNLDKGAEIIYQIPPDYITNEQFNKISEFIIPKTALCNKVLNLLLGNSYLLGYPIYLENQYYERVRFQFNFCMLIDKKEYEDNFYLYDNLIKKLNNTFETLEIENDFSFMKSNTRTIKGFMDVLYKELTSNKTEIKIHFEENDIYQYDEDYLDFTNNKNSLKRICSKEVLNQNINKQQSNLENNYFYSGLDSDTCEEKEEKEEKEKSEPIDTKKFALQKVSSEEPGSNLNIARSSVRAKNLNNDNKNINISCQGFKSMIISKKKSKKVQINFFMRYLHFSSSKKEIEDFYVPIWINRLNKDELKFLSIDEQNIINSINGQDCVKNISKNLELQIKYVKFILYNLFITDTIFFIDIFQYSNIYKSTTKLKNIEINGIFEKFRKFVEINNKSISFDNNFMDDKKFFSFYILLTNSKNVEDFRNKLKDFEFDINLFIAFGVYLKIIRRLHLYFFVKNDFYNKSPDYEDLEMLVTLMDGTHCADEICLLQEITLNDLLKSYEIIVEKNQESLSYCYKIYK